jgi:tubulin-specific chaperone C
MSQVMNPIAHNYPFAFAGKRPIMDPKERFYRQFQIEVQGEHQNQTHLLISQLSTSNITDIQNLISKLASIAIVGGERKDATDSILTRISKLSLEVADAADFIPAYDQRTHSAVC